MSTQHQADDTYVYIGDDKHAEAKQKAVDQWCYDHLPQYIQDCFHRPSDNGSMLSHVRPLAKERWENYLMMTRLHEVLVPIYNKDDDDPVRICAADWMDCEGVWEYINQQNAREAMAADGDT